MVLTPCSRADLVIPPFFLAGCELLSNGKFYGPRTFTNTHTRSKTWRVLAANKFYTSTSTSSGPVAALSSAPAPWTPCAPIPDSFLISRLCRLYCFSSPVQCQCVKQAAMWNNLQNVIISLDFAQQQQGGRAQKTGAAAKYTRKKIYM